MSLKETEFIDKAEDYYNQWDELQVNKLNKLFFDFTLSQGLPSEFSWDDKTAGAQLLMWELTADSKYKANSQVIL